MTTKQNIQRLFEIFTSEYNIKTRKDIEILGEVNGRYYSDNYLKIDYNPTYGGYRLDVVHTGTSESFFDGQDRRSGKEMVAYLQGLIAAKQSYPFEHLKTK